LFPKVFLSYPYSTRELVNIARHLQNYPTDDLSIILDDVFSFDAYDEDIKSYIIETFRKHGLPIGSLRSNETPTQKLENLGQKNKVEINYSDENKTSSMPKHGKEDPDNMPHVGGNTWAGGTGGSDTAGLGGVGGPYRLSSGNDISQVSQEVKDKVSNEAREAAR